MLTLQDKSLLPVDKAIAKGLGFAVHGQETKKALEKAGVFFDDNAKVVFHQMPSFAVEKIEGKINVLYTAYESEDLPDNYIQGADKMDLIFCTSDFVTKAFKRKLPRKEILTVPLGVDVNAFEYKKRKYSEPFIYLWVGAPDFRKGWDLIQKAWYSFEDDKNVRLIIKTTGRDKLETANNVIIDSRKVSTEDLIKIYHMAHCFIFPSYAEGFGLPLAEAMSTGLPCLFVPYAGVKQFANKKNAILLEYKMVAVDYGVPSKGAMADVKDMIESMRWVKDNYNQAIVIGKNARRTIERSFTWDDTARKIKSYIEEFIRYGTIKQNRY